ncbi:hypothetical protein [Octadecabacter ascidiaceicola]|uniref:hypothetical protein n=1 Tax=Octadecabacter ascidiaceicola TaxID=1655543 RepID=UPI000B8B6A15|nr:hypothetical protein [Octadecabacter ascidiaceicola]
MHGTNRASHHVSQSAYLMPETADAARLVILIPRPLIEGLGEVFNCRGFQPTRLQCGLYEINELGPLDPEG